MAEVAGAIITAAITAFFLKQGIQAEIADTQNCVKKFGVCSQVTLGVGTTGCAANVDCTIGDPGLHEPEQHVKGNDAMEGNIPDIALYQEDGSLLGGLKGSGKTDLNIAKAIGHSGPSNTQGEVGYVGVSHGGDDAICIAFVGVKGNDGSQIMWTGDMAKACDIRWSPSNRDIGLKSHVSPPCVWIGPPKDGSPSYSGFQIHMKDFIPDDARIEQYKNHTDTLCKSKPRQFFDDKYVAFSGISAFQPLLNYNKNGTDEDFSKLNVDGTFFPLPKTNQGLIGNGKRDLSHGSMTNGPFSNTTLDLKPQGNNTATKRPLSILERLAQNLVYSNHGHHSAREICEDPNSISSDFVSLQESLYCDWTHRQLYPLCSSIVIKDCFDTELHDIRHGMRVHGRSVIKTKRYSKVAKWGV